MTSFKRWFGAGAIVLVALALVACPALTPKVSVPLPDISFAHGAGAQKVDLSLYFSDTDSGTKYAATSSKTSVATVAVSGSTLTVTPAGPGDATVTVTVTASNGRTATQSFDVEVEGPPDPPVNLPPVIRTYIADMTIQVGMTKSLTLAEYYLDLDGPSLTYDAGSSDSSIASVSTPDAQSMITITAVAVGSANITVSASDRAGLAIPQTFAVTVSATPIEPPDNNQPRQTGTIPDVTGLKFGGSHEVDLMDYFVDDDGDEVTFTAVPRDTDVVTAAVSASMVTITVVAPGMTTIDVTATDPYNRSVRASFKVEVINQPPMPTMGVNEGILLRLPGGMTTFDLSDYFMDPESDDLAYSASVAPEGVATASVPAGSSMITITAMMAGDATITVTAAEVGNETNQASRDLSLKVTAVPNEEPEVVGEGIPDQSLQLVVTDMMESVTSEPIDLSMYFTDPDELPMPLEYSDDSDMTMIEGSMLTITASVAGKTMVTVTASDGEDTIPDEFYVMVTAPDAPTRTDASLGVQTLAHDAEPMDIELGTYFEGATSYDAESDDETVVTESVSNSTLTLTVIGAGTALVTVTADNSGGEATLTFRVKVSDPAAVALPTNPTPIPPQKVVLGTPMTVDISGYFENETGYRATGVDATVMAEVTEDTGMLTLTPVAHGTAEVRVTAYNTAGEVSDDFTVTVQAKPAFRSGKENSLPPLRIASADIATAPVLYGDLADLMTLFEDPDGDNASLKFKTETNDAKKVFVVKRTFDPDTPTTRTGVPANDAARDKALMAEGNLVDLYARAAGTATITVTVTDEDELETEKTFMVTVIAAANSDPGQGDDGSNATSFTAATRLTLSGGSKKAIDDKPINDYFSDDDFTSVSGDMLEFTVVYADYADATSVPAPTGTPPKVTVPAANQVAADDRVATVELTTYMWDGDPHGSEDKFTATVTPRKAGAAQTIVIIATDKAGAQHSHAFLVQVNQAPQPQGAQVAPAKPLTLGGVTTYSDITSATALRVGSEVASLDLVAAEGGYFSDKDTGDTLTCNLVKRGDNIFAANHPSISGNGTATVTMAIAPSGSALAKRGTAYVDVSCTDGFERTEVATLKMVVAYDASIR